MRKKIKLEPGHLNNNIDNNNIALASGNKNLEEKILEQEEKIRKLEEENRKQKENLSGYRVATQKYLNKHNETILRSLSLGLQISHLEETITGLQGENVKKDNQIAELKQIIEKFNEPQSKSPASPEEDLFNGSSFWTPVPISFNQTTELNTEELNLEAGKALSTFLEK